MLKYFFWFLKTSKNHNFLRYFGFENRLRWFSERLIWRFPPIYLEILCCLNHINLYDDYKKMENFTLEVRNYVFIPGWQYSNTICQYNSYQETWLNYYYLITPNQNSYLFMIHHYISDDDTSQWWTRILQADNCATDVVAPARTYPDNGVSGGYIYVKQ